MPAKYRLTHSEFAHTRTFRRVSGVLFTLLFGRIPGRSLAGFACVVSGKVARGAADRNRVRRIVRETARTSIASWPEGRVVVVVAKKGAQRAAAGEIRTDIANLLAGAQ